MVVQVEKKFLVLEHFSTPGCVTNALQLLAHCFLSKFESLNRRFHVTRTLPVAALAFYARQAQPRARSTMPFDQTRTARR